MGRIIRFSLDPHQEAQFLLPWYVNGRLDADEQAAVETHLRDCRECQEHGREELERARPCRRGRVVAAQAATPRSSQSGGISNPNSCAA